MDLDAFRSRLGLGQGRIKPRGAIAPSGDYVFALGEDETGRFFELAPGDYAEVTQDADLSDVDFVRAILRLRVPASLPTGFAWEASLVVDGVKCARATCMAGRQRLLDDLAANVSKLSGMHEIGVRLELMAA